MKTSRTEFLEMEEFWCKKEENEKKDGEEDARRKEREVLRTKRKEIKDKER